MSFIRSLLSKSLSQPFQQSRIAHADGEPSEPSAKSVDAKSFAGRIADWVQSVFDRFEEEQAQLRDPKSYCQHPWQDYSADRDEGVRSCEQDCRRLRALYNSMDL